MDSYGHQWKKTISVLSILTVATIVMFFVSLNTGLTKIPPLEVVKTIFGAGDEGTKMVLFDFRLPRMVLALLVGAGISLAGAILQGVSQNALADPGILGINAGAGFAVVLFMFFSQGTGFAIGALSIFSLPFTALAGAFVAALLIYVIAWKNGVTPVRLILVGIGINSAFGAAMLVFQLMMEPNDFTKALVWLSGTIWGTNWTFVLALLPWLLIFTPIAFYKARVLDVLNLGDPMAIGLGSHVERERRILLIIAVALAGACVSVGGGITFLGLVAPHLAKRIVGAKHARMLPVTVMLGAFLLLTADTIGRVVLAPAELPVGLVVSILGAPYFIYLLMKTR
ncbi:FecCD family ABC transporter permease [Cytobacillus gottheilii]|uniref:FecCD family ABC transporter permease n=1 Tax=Cytobacillus gottheilii TaxID=859144 RepID=UPI0009BC32F5|nr:iron ABC transporter permease [Cytobacillus gottheilii]